MHRILISLTALLTTAFMFMPTLAGAADAPMFEPAAGKAVIFVVREPLDSDAQARVDLDGMNIMTQPSTYYRWEVAPGPHTVVAGEDKITLNAAAGQTYFIRYSAQGGGQDPAVQTISRIEAAEGRDLVAQSKALRKVFGAPQAPAAGGPPVQRGGIPPLPGEKSSAQGSATEGERVGN